MLFVTVEGLIFRAGWYYKYLEPDSSAGTVENSIYWLTKEPHGSVPEVLVVGDSRVGEGFSAPAATAADGGKIRFWNFGISGATPRVWYYELRDADPTHRRFAAIVFALDHYSDEDGDPPIEDRVIDLNFVIGRLRIGDCPDFAFSMSLPAYRARAFAGCLFKGIPLRRDFQEFLRKTRDRVRSARNYRENGLRYVEDYPGRDQNLSGLTADFAKRAIHFPPGLDTEQHDTIEATLLPDRASDTGETTAYRKLWLGRILELYRDAPTKIIFLQLPRAPLPVPDGVTPPRFLQWALRQPRVSALPAETFRDLERPELFFDGYHLNHAGRGLFTGRLAELITTRIGLQ